ncbi:MAG: hypothetical protein ACFE8Z_09590 [Candidatus Hermodarchaeota archaeon]
MPIRINTGEAIWSWSSMKMAHEGITLVLVLLGIVLLVSYQFGPSKEVRAVKRLEAKAMLVPSAVLLFIIAAVLFSGVLGP